MSVNFVERDLGERLIGSNTAMSTLGKGLSNASNALSPLSKGILLSSILESIREIYRFVFPFSEGMECTPLSTDSSLVNIANDDLLFDPI